MALIHLERKIVLLSTQHCELIIKNAIALLINKQILKLENDHRELHIHVCESLPVHRLTF